MANPMFDENSVAESDFEHLSPTSAASVDHVHQWAGKLYWAHRLSKDVAAEAGPHTTYSELDMQLMRQMTDFPYALRMQSLREQGTFDNLPSRGNAFGQYVTTLGALLLSNNDGNDADIEMLLSGDRGGTTESVPSSPESSDTRFPQTSTLSQEMRVADTEIPRFTMALKEYGDISGNLPLYQIHQMSMIPPLFRAQVTVKGRSFSDTASTKKFAKHLASRQACTSLGIHT